MDAIKSILLIICYNKIFDLDYFLQVSTLEVEVLLDLPLQYIKGLNLHLDSFLNIKHNFLFLIFLKYIYIY